MNMRANRNARYCADNIASNACVGSEGGDVRPEEAKGLVEACGEIGSDLIAAVAVENDGGLGGLSRHL
jgi:hypothetical protein